MRLLRSIPLALLALLIAGPLLAQRLDGIAAVVNNEIVLESDVEEQLGLFLQQARLRPDSMLVDTLRKQILEQLIDDRLTVAEARRQGITVSDAEIKRQLEGAMEQKIQEVGGKERFAELLEQEHTTEAQIREKFRGETERALIRRRMLDKLFPKKAVPAVEAEAYFKAHPDKFPKFPGELRLAVVQIPPMADSVSEAKGKAAALAARRRIVGGEKFAKVAAEVSDDPNSARAGGDLGFFAQGSLEPTIEAAAFSLKIGQISEPVRTAYGWHLIEVLDRDTLKTAAHRDSLGPDKKPLLEAHARHILIRVIIEQDDIERARKLAERVRAEALKGTNFGILVRRYSKYQGNQDSEGDMGFIPMPRLQAEIRAGLDTLEIGQISELLPNAVGFNIFKLLDRHPERPYTLEEIRAELPEAVGDIQSREKYDVWVKGLRAKSQIEYR